MIFKGQSNLSLEIETSISLAGASSGVIMYKKPSGKIGWWPGVLSGTTITCNMLPDYLDESGAWEMQSKVTFPTGVGLGAITTMTVGTPL